jgi:Flp pilus assembly protein TadG
MERGARRREAGMTTVQLAILFPAVLFWLMLIVQYGLWWHGHQVANAAAAEAIDAAQAPDSTEAEGAEAARRFLATSGNLTGVTVTVNRGPDEVTAEVQGQAPQLIPGFTWSVTSRSHGPIERFVPLPER